MQLVDEYKNWLRETESQVKGSRQEMAAAMAKGLDHLPQAMKDYIRQYASSVLKGQTNNFVMDQANTAMKNALDRM